MGVIRKILLAEDNEINQKLFNMMITKLGYELDMAKNGFDVMQKIGLEHYDIIFMDLHMPEMDGFEAAKKIKKIYPKLPIVAVTADTFEDTSDNCKKAGMDDILKKPYRKEDISAIIDKYSTLLS